MGDALKRLPQVIAEPVAAFRALRDRPAILLGTIVVVISESHLAIHTWPELGYAAVDVFTCGDSVDPWVSCNYIKQAFVAQRMEAKEVQRGVFDHEVSHKPAVNY